MTVRRILNTDELTLDLLRKNLERLRGWVRSLELSPEESYATIVAGGAMYLAAKASQEDPEMRSLLIAHANMLAVVLVEAMDEAKTGEVRS